MVHHVIERNRNRLKLYNLILFVENNRFEPLTGVGRLLLSGRSAFELHDTYGFPIDLTREIAAAAGHEIDMTAFDGEIGRAHV